MNYQQRLLSVIPGGAHTYSRGFDQFPGNAPEILSRGKGAYVFGPDGARFLDYGMGLRAVNIGYAEEEIDNAAIEQIRSGNNLTRPSLVELDAAEKLVDLIDSADMVKFAKNGSSAVSAAVKLARAFTKRDLVARCADHPFFSYDDWFIGSTPITLGIPSDTLEKTKTFKFNDISSVERLVETYAGQLSCLVLEPAASEEPENGFLTAVRNICDREGIVLIFDEMITGFRWHLKGAQHIYSVKPDLCTFGKAMANGFSVACVAGKRDIMSLGSIENSGAERLFLMSTTHGAEMCGLGAFIATVDFLIKNSVIDHLWEYGRKLKNLIYDLSLEYEISDSFKICGAPCSPYFRTLDKHGNNSLALRTVFVQEMLRKRVLMPWIALSFRHGEEEFELTRIALHHAFKIYKSAFENGASQFLQGGEIKPVFRPRN